MFYFLILTNLVAYAGTAALILLGGARLARRLRLESPARFILLAFGAAAYAPAIISLGHFPGLVPLVAFPHFYRNSAELLPLNAGVSVVSASVAVLTYAYRLRLAKRREDRDA